MGYDDIRVRVWVQGGSSHFSNIFSIVYLFIPEKPGEVFHDHRLVKVCEAELGCQVNHGNHSLLPDHRLSVKETILNLMMNKKSQSHILDSEGDILYRLKNENFQR